MRVLAGCLVAVLLGCGGSSRTGPERSCEQVLRYASASESAVQVVGEWSGLSPQPMQRRDDGTFEWRGTLDARPQGYGYRFQLADGGLVLDPLVDRTRWAGRDELSRLDVEACSRPLLTLEAFSVSPEGELAASLTALRGKGAPGLTPPRVLLDGQALASSFDAASGRLNVEAHALPRGKHHLKIEVTDAADAAAQPIVLPFWVEPAPFDWRDAVLYFAFTDRFRNGDPANDAAVPGVDARANFAGGDFSGLTRAIEEGYFEDLGVNALWISPLQANAEGGWNGTDGRLYSGYHGYWPTRAGETQARFGSRAELIAMVDAAHRHGLRVVADVVLNHVHEQHPWYQQHKTDGWFNVGNSCVCGTPGCDWDARALDCWFTSYLPDLDWRSSAMGDAVTAELRGWLEDAGFDGLRIDAAKHLLPTAIRAARAELRRLTEPTGATPWLVGETFTGSTGHELLNAHVGPHELDGQFEFTLYWALVDAFAKGKPLTLVAEAMQRSDGALLPGGLFAPFLGNHDLPRFASLAAGQIGADPMAQAWGPPLQQPDDDATFARLRQAFAFLLAQPGVPLLYYGDEVGLAGAGDPDNRRMMSWSGLSPRQAALRTAVAKLTQARRASVALRRGARDVLTAEADLLVFQRTSGTEAVVVAINRGATARTLDLPLARGATGSGWTELTTGVAEPAASTPITRLQRTVAPGEVAWFALRP